MNKGFQSLPEYVQRKIDPEMAKNYMGGGSVMQRPMFRQAGGPMMAPPMAPPPMAPPPMAPPPMAPEPSMDMASQQLQQMQQQTSGIGSAVAQQTLSNIDAADNPKSMIDALRGNERPLEARYTELAGFVGEADAQQTPESVLAMVQPTIMMTEEGALDSGVGELMQGLAGQIDMETPSGEATQMGQGVGELMAMGAGNTPPVNFNQGGAVRHYAEAGAVISEAQKMAPDFQSYFEGAFDKQARAAALDEQKKLTKAQMLFDIAQTALAAGAPTDQPMSFAERLMSAAQGTQLFNKIGDRAAGMLSAKQAQAAEERQIRMAARQGALGQAQSNKAAADALALAKAKKTPPTPKFATLYKFDPETQSLSGDGIRYNIADPASLTQYNASLATGKYRDETNAAPLLEAYGEEIKPQETTSVLVTSPITIDGYTYKKGEIANLTVRQKQTNARKWIAEPEEAKFVTLNKGSETKLVITNAPGATKTLNDLAKLGWSTSTLAAETAAKKEILTLTQGFDKGAQERLFANNILLQGMRDKNSEEGRKLQKLIADDANALKETLQNNEQLFTEGRDQTLQGYKEDLQSYGADIAKELQALKDTQGIEIEKLRAKLRDQSSKVTSELNLANQLEVAGVKNVYEISQIDSRAEKAMELAKLRATLADASRIDQNVFTAAESLLNRAATAENNILSINARSALQAEAQRFELEENEKDRVLKASESALARVASLNLQVGSQEHTAALQEARLKVQQSEGLSKREADALNATLNRASRETMQIQGQEFDALQAQIERDFKGSEAEKKALATLLQNMRSIAISDRGLDLQEARDIINGNATTSRAAVDRERFDLEKAEKPLMAAKGTAATLLYLSNQTALDAYADGTMSQTDANAMSATIEWWSNQGSEEFSPYANDGQGGYVSRQNIVPSAAKAAVAARRKLLGPKSVPSLDGKNLKFTKAGTPGSAAAYRFKVDEQGRTVIDFDSFKDDPTLVITGGVDLTKSIGFGSGVNRFFSGVAEFAKDISFGLIGNDTTKRAQVTRAGDSQLKGLGLTTLKVLREDINGRLFKLDMDKIEEEIEGFKPGAFGQDRAALAQLYMTRQMLAGQFKAVVEIANNAKKYGKEKSTDASITLPKVESLIGEFTAAIMMFEKSLDTSSSEDANTASNQVQDPSGGSITKNADRVK